MRKSEEFKAWFLEGRVSHETQSGVFIGKYWDANSENMKKRAACEKLIQYLKVMGSQAVLESTAIAKGSSSICKVANPNSLHSGPNCKQEEKFVHITSLWHPQINSYIYIMMNKDSKS